MGSCDRAPARPSRLHPHSVIYAQCFESESDDLMLLVPSAPRAFSQARLPQHLQELLDHSCLRLHLLPQATCSLINRHHLRELFTFNVRQLVVRFELDSQVPCTTFLHERDASVRGFPYEVRISTVGKEDRVPTTTAQILC